MQRHIHPIEVSISTSELSDGAVQFSHRRLQDIVGYAVNNPRKAISDRKTGTYVIYSPKGFTSTEGFPVAECVIISGNGLLEIIPRDYDKQKIIRQFDSTVNALDFIFEKYPTVSSFESVTYSN